jgi:Flp pilus assembly protein TadD
MTKIKPGKRNIEPEKLKHDNNGYLFNINSLLGFTLFCVAFAIYLNSINHGYALDDVAVIQQNKFTKQGIAGIPSLLKTFYWQGYWDQNAGLYRPLSMISFALEYQFFKDKPIISHFINVLLYAITAILVFHFLRKLFEKQSVVLPYMITLLFVTHPTHTEVVANIKSRDELLCFIFFLLTMINMLSFVKKQIKRNLYAALVCYFLSLLSKEGALVFLGIFPITLYFFTDAGVKKIIDCTLQLAVVSLVFILIHQYVISHGPTRIAYSYHDNALISSANLPDRIATAILICGYYLKLLFLPHPLSYDYSFNQFPVTSFSNLLVLLILFIHIGLLVYAYKFFKEKNLYAFTILFYLISMSMVSNIFMLIGTTMADRLLYVPSLAFCMAVTWFIIKSSKVDISVRTREFTSLKDFYRTYSRPLLIVLIVSTCFSFKTISRNNDWTDNFTLFSKDVKSSAGSSRTHYNYGTELMFKKAFVENDSLKKNLILDKVIAELEIAAKIDSIDPGTYLNLSTACYQRKNYLKAIKYASLATKYNPADGKGYTTLGNSYYRTGKYEQAIENLKKSIERGFGEQEAYNTIGVSYFGLKDYIGAIKAFNKSVELKPIDITALNNLGSAYGLSGNFKMSIETFRKSYSIDSSNRQTLYYMALTYQNMKDIKNAEIFTKKYQRTKN